jgi:hypothetical protein
MSKLYVDAVEPEGITTDLTLGDSGGGDKVVIPGTIKISGGSPGVGKYLQSDAAGDGSWGTVTMPDATPRWLTYVGTNQSLTNNTNTTFQYDTERYDSDGAFDTSTYTFTVPVGEAGVYFGYCSVNITLLRLSD